MVALDDSGRVILTDEVPGIQQFIVREITEVHEFEELFRLRYRVLRHSRLASFYAPTDREVDINRFDLTARHLGLFLQEQSGERMIGYCRGVVKEPSPWAENIKRAALVLGTDLDAAPNLSGASPCLAYMANAEAITKQLEQWEAECKRVGEATRLSIDPQYRSLGAVRFLVECMFAFFIPYLGLDIGVCHVSRTHRLFYRAYGFERIPGVPDQWIEPVRMIFSSLYVTKNSIAPSCRDQIESLARDFELKGFASRSEVHSVACTDNSRVAEAA